MPTGFLARLLSTASHANLPPEDARTAIATVLVMAARADGVYDAGERAVIDRILSERYNLTPDEAASLRIEGEAVEAEAIDVFQFTRAIKQVVPLEERTAIIEALWSVVLADNVRDPHEDALMRELAERLGLSPMESAQARQRVSS
jgi:uncharacterized tellurite resistance protein B-like protein